MIEVKFTCDNAQELKHLLALLAEGNEEAASAYEEAPKAPKKGNTQPKAKTPQKAAQAPVESTEPAELSETAPWEETPAPSDEDAPIVSLQELQTLGRKLAAAGKGAAIQAILKKRGVTLLSKIPEAERAVVLAEMQGVEADNATD